MAKKKAKRKKLSGGALAYQRKAKLLIGMQMQWEDADPLTQTKLKADDITISHVSPFISNERAFKLWRENIKILDNHRFWWSVEIESHFDFEKRTMIEERAITSYANTVELSPVVQGEIESIFRHGVPELHSITKITLRCLSSKREFNEKDGYELI